MQRLEQEIHAMAPEFNIASPRQLQEILFVEQKLPVIKRTAKTGQHRRRRSGGVWP